VKSTAGDNERSVLPRAEEKRAVVEAMFDRIAGNYERTNRVISMGFDRRWRRYTVRRLGLGPGALVLDLACGTGDMGRVLGANGYDVVGLDFSANMLQHAHSGSRFVRADVLALPMAAAIADGVTCGFALRNLVDLTTFFSECSRVLRKGGRVAIVDAAMPEHRWARIGHRVWFTHVVPWLGARMSESTAYRYLAASTVYLPPNDTLRSVLSDAGFSQVEIAELTFGAVKVLTATKR
jgi:demethylmenaquinone methyltransferase / 2-methoxy-6-polyprenyl-1,4-benzoquinol methylase